MGSFRELKKLVEYMRVFGFTGKGRRYWFDRNSDKINAKLAEFVDKRIRGQIADFICDEATRVRHSLSTEQVEEYLTLYLQEISRAKVLDDFAWMAGTGRYAQ